MDLVFFALIALFIGYKYYSILGRKDDVTEDLEARKEEIKKRLNQELKILDLGNNYEESSSIETLEPVTISTNSKIIEVIEKIHSKNSNFTESFFIKGAKNVFELIIKEFSIHNLSGLEPWLSKDIYNHFASNIQMQQTKLKRIDATIVRLDAEVIDAYFNDNFAHLVVKFNSEQIILQYDNNNQLIDGNPRKTQKIEDIWTFERSIKSSSQKWTVAKIENL